MDARIVGFIIGLVLVVITLVLIFWGNKKSNAAIDAKQQPAIQPGTPTPAAVSAPGKPDDLTIIEGIGPKINGILQRNGIQTFAQLAACGEETLIKILKENDLQFTKPHSWPEQARLAAQGKMDELKAFQEKLVAGR